MKKHKSCTDFLFCNSSYLTGAATVFDLSGQFYEYNSSDSDCDADEKAIKNDFWVIGNDLKKSISKFELDNTEV